MRAVLWPVHVNLSVRTGGLVNERLRGKEAYTK